MFSTGFAKRRTDTNLTTIWNSIKTQGVCKPEGERGGKTQKIKTLIWGKVWLRKLKMTVFQYLGVLGTITNPFASILAGLDAKIRRF